MFKKYLFYNFLVINRTSRWLYNRFTESGLLVMGAVVITGIFAIDIRQTMSYHLFSLTFFILLYAFIVTLRNRKKYSIERILPDYASVGVQTEYQLSVTNLNQVTEYEISIVDELSSSDANFYQYSRTIDKEDKKRNFVDRVIGYPRFVSYIRKLKGARIWPAIINSINSNETLKTSLKLKPSRRGYLYFNDIHISQTDSFGIARSTKIYSCSEKLLVLPKCYDFPNLHLSGKRNYQKGDIQQASTVGDSQEFFSLRDYRPGDPRKLIHWPSYAKRGYPIVKENHDEYFARIALVLDTCLTDKPEQVFEDAVSIAASAALSNREPDGLLDLVFIDNEVYRFTTGRGMRSMENILEILACVTPSSNEQMDLLGNTLIEYSTETSCFLIILLDWDDTRKKFISNLIQKNISVFVIVVSAEPLSLSPNDPLSGRSDLFRNILSGDVESQLSTIL